MELIERYLYEIRRHLSPKNREDIIKELRSLLTDNLENQYGANPTQEQAASVLKEFGSPQAVAARYHPEGQYLVGPALYPLFKTVTGIVISAVIGAQVIVWLVTSFLSDQKPNPLGTAGVMFDSALIALGWVVIAFMILQRFDVRPNEKAKPWDPASLPPVAQHEEVNRIEQIVGIIICVVILSVLTWFQGEVGMVSSPGGTFYPDPVFTQYLVWIFASLLVTIGFDLYLLWQGRWTQVSRWLKAAVDLLAIAVLALLVSGHQAWLGSHGVTSFLSGIDVLSSGVENNGQAMMMVGFWISLSIGLIIAVIVWLTTIIKTIRHTFQQR